jgi:hypothetical protein
MKNTFKGSKIVEFSAKIPKYYLSWYFNLPAADKSQLKVIRARQDSYT